MKILGIDPSLRCTGVALIEGNKILWVKSIRTKVEFVDDKDFDDYRTLDHVVSVIRLECPFEWGYMGIEKPFLSQTHSNATSFFRSGVFIGGLVYALMVGNDNWEWVGTQAVKTALGIKNKDTKELDDNAKKNLRVERVERLFEFTVPGSSQEDRWAIADALGIANAIQLRGIR